MFYPHLVWSFRYKAAPSSGLLLIFPMLLQPGTWSLRDALWIYTTIQANGKRYQPEDTSMWDTPLHTGIACDQLGVSDRSLHGNSLCCMIDQARCHKLCKGKLMHVNSFDLVMLLGHDHVLHPQAGVGRPKCGRRPVRRQNWHRCPDSRPRCNARNCLGDRAGSSPQSTLIHATYASVTALIGLTRKTAIQ